MKTAAKKTKTSPAAPAAPVVPAQPPRGVQQLRQGKWRWLLEASALELLDSENLPGEEPPADAVILRDAPGRVVYRTVAKTGRPIVIKMYMDVTRGDRVRRLFGSRGLNEWRLLGTLRARGIPVPRRLALGEKRGRSILVLDALMEHDTLAVAYDRYLEQSPSVRGRLPEAVADLLLLLHRGGFWHRDLHPGNILAPRRLGRTLPADLYILDLHKGRLRPKLRRDERLADLADLDLFFAWHGSKGDRVRCGRRYLQRMLAESQVTEPSQSRPEVHEILRALGRRTLTASRRFWLERDLRCLGGNRYFSELSLSGGATGGVLRTGCEGLLAMLPEVDALLSLPATTILKHGKSATSGLVALPSPVAGGESDGGGAVPGSTPQLPARAFVKRYNRAGRGEDAKVFLRGSRAGRAFQAGWALEVRGLPSPRVLAWMGRKDGRTVLVTEAVEDAHNLADLLGAAGLPEPTRLPLLDQLARVLKKMHLAGVSHRDLKTTNVLVGGLRIVPAPAGGASGALPPALSEVDVPPADMEALALPAHMENRPRLNLVDLDGIVVHPAAVPWKRRARDLVRLVADAEARGGMRSLTERRRFLSIYLSHILDEQERLGALEELVGRLLSRRSDQVRRRHP